MTIGSVLQRGTVNPRYFSLNYSSYPHIWMALIPPTRHSWEGRVWDWQRTSTHKHLRQWVRLLVHKPTAKTIADSEEKGNSNQNTIHHQKKYYYYTSQSLLQGPVKAFFSIVTSSPAKYSLSVCVQAKKQCLNQNILVLAYNYKQNAITVQYNIFL